MEKYPKTVAKKEQSLRKTPWIFPTATHLCRGYRRSKNGRSWGPTNKLLISPERRPNNQAFAHEADEKACSRMPRRVSNEGVKLCGRCFRFSTMSQRRDFGCLFLLSSCRGNEWADSESLGCAIIHKTIPVEIFARAEPCKRAPQAYEQHNEVCSHGFESTRE